MCFAVAVKQEFVLVLHVPWMTSNGCYFVAELYCNLRATIFGFAFWLLVLNSYDHNQYSRCKSYIFAGMCCIADVQ